MRMSLITVCYNSAETIRSALESVFAQNCVNVEYIVVDGGSTDGTIEIIKDFERQLSDSMPHKESNISFRWISERDDGMYDALNKGIRMATGDVLGILNSDDLLESPNTLEHIANCFRGETEKDKCSTAERGTDSCVDAVYADVRFVKDDLVTTVRYYGASHWCPWMHYWGYMPPHPSVYIRREFFEKFGGYKLGYQISADFELMVRFICRNRIKTVYLPECVVKMRMGGKSTRNWKANVLLNVENVRANRENGYFSCFVMMIPKYLFKIWGFVFKGQ